MYIHETEKRAALGTVSSLCAVCPRDNWRCGVPRGLPRLRPELLVRNVLLVGDHVPEGGGALGGRLLLDFP